MQDPTVEKLFNEQLEYYSKNQSPKDSPLVDLFADWMKTAKVKKTLAIADFGGAAGQLLAAFDHVYSKNNLTNIEIISGYQKNQVLKKIKFINCSILNCHLPNNSFDVIIMRDVLHHLVGKNLSETRRNQQKALKEIKRLLCPGGIALIEELTNQSPAICRLIYFLSRLNSKIGLKLPKLEISPNTVIFPLTPPELANLIQKDFAIMKKTVKYKKIRPWSSRLTHLFSPYGKFIVLAQK